MGGHCPKKDLLFLSRLRVGIAREITYHRHPTVSVRKPPMGPPKLRPDVAAMFT